jgi:hypothetical protein
VPNEDAYHVGPGKQIETAPATARGKLLEFAMILREWYRAERRRESDSIDRECRPENERNLEEPCQQEP